MRRNIRLRYRLFVMILPLVVAVVLLSGVLASLEARTALTRIASRHLTFKAEQLRDYFFSEWQVMTNLGLNTKPEYLSAAKESFRSYAASLLRSNTELVLAVDSHGKIAEQIGYQALPSISAGPDDSVSIVVPKPGWFSGKLLGSNRVGVAFKLDPLGWTVLVTDMESAFFSEVNNMRTLYLWILLGSVVVIAFFLSVFIRHITGPVERLTETIGRIASTNDLNQRAQIQFTDEIGVLANEFNNMISTLQSNYHELELTSQAEKRARQIAVEREAETLYLLARVSDFRDKETGSHLRRIGELSAMLSRLIGQDEDRQTLIRNGAPLHDIGKLGIPDSILLKPGALTKAEFLQMQRHTLIGHDLLKDARSVFLIEGARIALSHHEKWDGTGYPKGIRGDQIPLSGRIVGLVDVFDALTSDRPYKKAWDFDRVHSYILEGRARHFDPDLVDVFITNFDSFRRCLVEADREYNAHG